MIDNLERTMNKIHQAAQNQATGHAINQSKISQSKPKIGFPAMIDDEISHHSYYCFWNIMSFAVDFQKKIDFILATDFSRFSFVFNRSKQMIPQRNQGLASFQEGFWRGS